MGQSTAIDKGDVRCCPTSCRRRLHDSETGIKYWTLLGRSARDASKRCVWLSEVVLLVCPRSGSGKSAGIDHRHDASIPSQARTCARGTVRTTRTTDARSQKNRYIVLRQKLHSWSQGQFFAGPIVDRHEELRVFPVPDTTMPALRLVTPTILSSLSDSGRRLRRGRRGFWSWCLHEPKPAQQSSVAISVAQLPTNGI